MNIEYIKDNGMDIAVVSSDGKVIVDTQSALDLAMTVKYEAGTANLVLDKRLICEDFFILSTGVAGKFCKSLSTTTCGPLSTATIPITPASP